MGFPPEIEQGADRGFAFTECHAAFYGMWLTLPAFWINHPTKDDEAARKVYQLETARKDRDENTSDVYYERPRPAPRAFVAGQGLDRVIYKAFSGTEQAWRETRMLRKEELDGIDQVEYAPVIFQEYIPAEADLRITVVGDRIFACAIDTRQTEYQVDFRMVMDKADMRAVELPAEVQSQIREYMRTLGLVYGAIDMRLTPGGEYGLPGNQIRLGSGYLSSTAASCPSPKQWRIK